MSTKIFFTTKRQNLRGRRKEEKKNGNKECGFFLRPSGSSKKTPG
jgi:hypothetical protein